MSRINRTQKDRRRGGWTHPDLVIPGRLLKENDIDLLVTDFWDEWNDHRDGTRGYNDKTKYRPELRWYEDFWNVSRWNWKIRRWLKIRQARKAGRFACNF